MNSFNYELLRVDASILLSSRFTSIVHYMIVSHEDRSVSICFVLSCFVLFCFHLSVTSFLRVSLIWYPSIVFDDRFRLLSSIKEVCLKLTTCRDGFGFLCFSLAPTPFPSLPWRTCKSSKSRRTAKTDLNSINRMLLSGIRCFWRTDCIRLNGSIRSITCSQSNKNLHQPQFFYSSLPHTNLSRGRGASLRFHQQSSIEYFLYQKNE